MPTEGPPTSVAAIATQLPPFLPADVEVWFIQVEAQFSKRSITTSKTKYEEIICALPMEYATDVRDLLVDPPEENSYKKLKEKLISCIADSECQKIWQLLTTEELGDCKPTQLLCKMQQLLGEKTPIDNSFLRELFLQRLPAKVQMILASVDDMNISKLAKMAEKIMNVGTPMVAAVSTSTEDDRICKIFHEEFNKQHKSCPRSFSNSQIGGVGIVHVGGPLHVDVHLTDK